MSGGRGMKINITRSIAVFTLSAFLFCPPIKAKADSYIAGLWDTNFDLLSLHESRDGGFVGLYYYKGMPAHLYATTDPDGTYSGEWVQGTSEVRCRTRKYGSPYWGTFRFMFTGNKYAGLWNYCDRPLVDGANFRWTGTLNRPM